jgi:hypothetical protein
VLNLLFALLERDYGLLRAQTPFYEIYNIKPKSDRGWGSILNDDSRTANAIRKHWKTKPTQTEVSSLVRTAAV